MLNKLPSLIKPTLTTNFHIDFDWWKKQDRNWRNALESFLCEEHQPFFSSAEGITDADLIDPETGEVSQGDPLIDILTNHCAKQEGFLSPSGPLVDSIFKVFLVNNNQPLNSKELAEITGRDADIILRTIGTLRVYKGIRPV
ncbi:MAG TPA: hypothetical protein PK459_00640 [Anaerolineaceae bacterium]|jgi:hypothetical protein|nr:hypothetical protein [Anaerolineaceae bacterium]